MVSELLAASELILQQLDGIAFGRGPGAFTGVRIAAGVAQGLAFGTQLPVAPISTLRALAQGAYRIQGTGHVLTAIDARMGEVYWGAYGVDDAGRMAAIVNDCVALPDQVRVPHGDHWFGVGSGWQSYHRALSQRVGKALEGHEGKRFPQAQDVALLGAETLAAGNGVGAHEALPLYLRNRVAAEPANRP